MAIISTVGGSTANSYVSENYADTYFENHPYASAWTGQEPELVYAATLLDSLVSWYGDKVDITQRMQHPRIVNGITQTDIELGIKNAQCELILYLLANTAVVEDNTLNKLKVGPISLDFNEKKPTNPDLLPPIVKGFVSRWGMVKSANFSISAIKLERV